MCTGTGINHDGFLIHFIERYYISKKQPVGVKHNSNGHVFDSRWVLQFLRTHSSVVERSIAEQCFFTTSLFIIPVTGTRGRSDHCFASFEGSPADSVFF